MARTLYNMRVFDLICWSQPGRSVPFSPTTKNDKHHHTVKPDAPRRRCQSTRHSRFVRSSPPSPHPFTPSRRLQNIIPASIAMIVVACPFARWCMNRFSVAKSIDDNDRSWARGRRIRPAAGGATPRVRLYAYNEILCYYDETRPCRAI